MVMASLGEVALGIGLLTGLVWVLTLAILGIRTRLLPQGDVAVRINESIDITVPPGGKLHEALAARQILLPTACGGRGTCGQCRVQVLAGGGTLLPTERALINRRDAAAGWRLACQVTVNDALQLRIPEALLESREWTCRVRSNRSVATFIKELVLEMPAGESLDFKAGGYVQVECSPHHLRYAEFDIGAGYRRDWERLGLFRLESSTPVPVRRAYSLANSPAENAIVMLNVRVATPPPSAPPDTPPGIVSSWIFKLEPGDEVRIAGPFGEFFHRDTQAEMVYVGGGVGMAPLRSHILDLLGRLESRRRISYWYGARSLREAFYVEEFERLAREHENFSFHLALSEPLPEDGWTGPAGFIHDVLRDQYLGAHPAPEDCEYYLCGPPVMIAAVNRMLHEFGVEEDNILFDDFGS